LNLLKFRYLDKEDLEYMNLKKKFFSLINNFQANIYEENYEIFENK
jgi:hypothetical protein